MAEGHLDRRLLAILAADVVGYSRLMEADEERTIARLRLIQAELAEPLIAEYRGRIVKRMGDGALVAFDSVVDAVVCAIEIQKAVARREASVSADRRIVFRIGVNLGDVALIEGDVYGDGVNIAARLEQSCEPGGVLVSGTAFDHLRGKLDLPLDSVGELKVKNIERPVRAYRVRLDGSPSRGRLLTWFGRIRHHRRIVGSAAVALLLVSLGFAGWNWRIRAMAIPTGFPSLAVLPFENFSGDPTLDRYGDGLAENLITDLARFPDLTVLSRNSSFAYKGKGLDPRQLGQELNVGYVLEGSVQKSGDDLRIAVQLIDARTNLHVWAEAYQGRNPSSLQDDTVRKVLAALPSGSGQIRRQEYKKLAGRDPADFDEYDFYLSGHEVFSRFASIEEHDRAGQIWRQGLERFPDSALLRVALAWYHFDRPWDFSTPKPKADYRRARELATEALAGPSVSPMVYWSGHLLTAYTFWFEGNFERAVASAEVAVAAAPYDAETLSLMSRVQVAAGNLERGLQWIQDSSVRDPKIWRNTRILAWTHYLAGRYGESVEAAQRHTELSRQYSSDALSYMAASYVHLGRLNEARAAMARAVEAEPDWSQLRAREVRYEQQYKDRTTAEREIADYALAGLPELPFGYDTRGQDRLSSDDIKSLMFGHRLQGVDIRSGKKFSQVVASDGSVEEKADWGDGSATVLLLGQGLICHSWKDWGALCGAVFRNAKGQQPEQSGYTWVTSCCELQFSVSE